MQLKIIIFFLFLTFLGCRKENEQNAGNEADVPVKDVNVVASASRVQIQNDTTDQGSDKYFNEAKWKIKEGKDYPYRASMYKELLYTDKLRVMKKDEVLNTLGKPDRIDNLYLFYQVSKESIGFFPLSMKTLVIKLKDNGGVEWIKVHGK